MSTLPPQRRRRGDIQALRGFAVLSVLFYHAKLSFIPAGYLGVDVFFVISGFLITRLIGAAIEAGSFRCADFYFRRAKRLLPAAYATFLVTALLAPLFLAGAEMADLRAQMRGAVTFSANLVLLNQSGYFGGAAELKPLLHVWSLALEEQYYFILPALMALAPRRFWLRGAVALLLASLALCLARAGQEATFYLLPTRAWELMIGSVGALAAPGPRWTRVLDLVFWPALLALLVLPLIRWGGAHPGPPALLICLATLALILRRHPALPEAAPVRALGRVGDLSYSLYLVHWPLFAFFNNVWVGATDGGVQPQLIRIGLLALSLPLAFLLNRYVEQPCHRMPVKLGARALARIGAASLGLLLIAGGVARGAAGARDYAQIRRVNYGLGPACAFKSAFAALPACRSGERPELLFWGDSFAMHLVPGMLGLAGGAPLAQATRSVCGPLLGLAVVRPNTPYDRRWAQDCIAFNDQVLAYLGEPGAPATVVLSSPFGQFVNRGERLLVRAGGADHVQDADLAPAIDAMRRTVAALRALGKRVVVVAPPPSSGFDSSRCVERLERRLPLLGVADQCQIDLGAYHRRRASVLAFLAALPEQAGVEVIGFDSYLCDATLCRTYIDGTFIYRDAEHLSHDGSVLLVKASGLAGAIERRAR